MHVERQFESLRSAYPRAALVPNADTSSVIIVPELALPPGWNRTNVGVAFIAPAGYPVAAPDCFWTEPGLMLANGGTPQNTGTNQLPGIPAGWLWFSWHPSRWDANRGDNLMTYLKVIRRRFEEIR